MDEMDGFWDMGLDGGREKGLETRYALIFPSCCCMITLP